MRVIGKVVGFVLLLATSWVWPIFARAEAAPYSPRVKALLDECASLVKTPTPKAASMTSAPKRGASVESAALSETGDGAAVAGNGGDDGAKKESEKQDAESDGKNASPEQTLESMFGKSAPSDYVAKHFSLLFGAVVTSPFQFTEITPSPTPAMRSAQADPTPQPKRYSLNTGSTSASAFIEAGVRYRWAWLDRRGIGKAAEDVPMSADEKAERTRIDGCITRTRKDLNSIESRIDELGAADVEDKSGFDSRFQRLVLDRDALRSQLERLESKSETAGGRAEKSAKTRALWSSAQEGLPIEFVCTHQELVNGQWDWGSSLSRWSLTDCIKPGDFEARMGYVFNGGSPSGLSSLVSNSNFYGDLAMGMGLIRATLPTDSPDEPPMRSSINLEGSMTQVTDSSFVQVHSRYLIGLGFAVGVPLLTPQKPVPTGRNGGADAAGEPTPKPTPPNAPIVEFVARAGAVNVDVPSFVDNTREVNVKNDTPDFHAVWGFGLDLEMNVPITSTLGYLMARGSINAGINPSPWGFQVGYTIPLSTLVGGIIPAAAQ